MAFPWFGKKKKEELGPEFGSEAAGFESFAEPQYGQTQTDELGLPLSQNVSAPEAFSPYPPPQSFGSMPSTATQRQFGAPQPYQQPTQNRDIDLLASKLDAIKATLDAIDQRLKTVERLLQSDEGYKFKKGW